MLKVFKKKSFMFVFWIFFYFFIFCLLLKGGFSYLDPDLGWHLRVGETISQTHQVPSQNVYNYTYAGDWVDHEWLSNYLIFQIYHNLGYPALVIFFALIIIIVLVLLNMSILYLWKKKGEVMPIFLVVILQLLGVVASLPHFGVRIQEFALLFLFLTLAIIYFYDKNKKWPYLLILIPLFYLWACLHASFLIGLFIIFAWAGIKALEKIINNSKIDDKFKKYFVLENSLRHEDICIFVAVAIAAFLATLITPYHFKLYSFLGGYSDTLYLSYIQEWFSQFSYPFLYWQLFYLSLASLVLFINIFYIKKIKINIWFSFIFLLFYILSFKSRRHFPLLFVSTFILLIYVLSDYLRDGVGKIKDFPKWLKVYLLFCLFLTSIFVLSKVNYTNTPFYSRAYEREYPIQAVQFINQHKEYDNFNILNNYNWGGFLIYTNPDRKIFIDGRLPQVYYKGHSFLAEYLEFYKSEDVIKGKLDEYDIGLVLLKSKDQKTEVKKWERIFFAIKEVELNPVNNLRAYLDKSSGWQIIYKDEASVIYIKK